MPTGCWMVRLVVLAIVPAPDVPSFETTAFLESRGKRRQQRRIVVREPSASVSLQNLVDDCRRHLVVIIDALSRRRGLSHALAILQIREPRHHRRRSSFLYLAVPVAQQVYGLLLRAVVRMLAIKRGDDVAAYVLQEPRVHVFLNREHILRLESVARGQQVANLPRNDTAERSRRSRDICSRAETDSGSRSQSCRPADYRMPANPRSG